MSEEYVTYDRLRAELADFRADSARFREEVRSDLASMRLEIAGMRTEMYKLHSQAIVWLAGIVATGVALNVTLIKWLN